MADKIPVKAKYSGLDVIALQEFEPADTIPLAIISGFSAGVTAELANNDISALGDVDATSPANNEVLTFNSTSGNWEASLSPGSSAAIWGSITGTLSNQTDLQNALDLKTDETDFLSHTGDGTIHFTEGSIDHTLITNIGTNTHPQIDSHIGDANIHYGDAPADTQDYVRKDNTWVVATSATFGEYSGEFDASTNNFPVASNQGDWFNTTVAGTVDGVVFIVGDVLIALVDTPSTTTYAGNWTTVPNVSVTDHTQLTGIGTNTHPQIDTHISDGTIHYTQSAISIPKSQISDFVEGDYLHTTGDESATGKKVFFDDMRIGNNFASPYVLSLQNNAATSWLEILNDQGAGQGAFLGITGNDFELWNYQAGATVFYTGTAVSTGTPRYTITNDGKHIFNSLASVGTEVASLSSTGELLKGATLTQLSDVIALLPTTNDVLTFNGTNWIPQAAGGSGVTWGSITGTLSNQTDLQAALDTKIETATDVGGGNGVTAISTGTNLNFKTLVAGDGVQITPSATELLIEGRREAFYAHNGNTTQTFTSTLITVLFPTIIRSDPTYTYSAGTVTIGKTGWYFIEYQFSADNTGNSRASSKAGITVNSVVAQLPGSLGWAYHRNSASGKSTATGRVLVNLTAGDIVRVMAQRDGAGSTLVTLAEGCRLSIIEVGAP